MIFLLTTLFAGILTNASYDLLKYIAKNQDDEEELNNYLNLASLDTQKYFDGEYEGVHQSLTQWRSNFKPWSLAAESHDKKFLIESFLKTDFKFSESDNAYEIAEAILKKFAENLHKYILKCCSPGEILIREDISSLKEDVYEIKDLITHHKNEDLVIDDLIKTMLDSKKYETALETARYTASSKKELTLRERFDLKYVEAFCESKLGNVSKAIDILENLMRHDSLPSRVLTLLILHLLQIPNRHKEGLILYEKHRENLTDKDKYLIKIHIAGITNDVNLIKSVSAQVNELQVELLVPLAQQLIEFNEIDSAKNVLVLIQTHDSDNPFALLIEARLYLENSINEVSNDTLDKFKARLYQLRHSLSPKNNRTEYGLCLYELCHISFIQRDYENVLKICSDFDNLGINEKKSGIDLKAQAYNKLGLYEEEKSCYENLLKIDESHYRARIRIASYCINLPQLDIEKINDLLEPLLEQHDDHDSRAQAIDLLCVAAHRTGADDALQKYSELIERDTTTHYAYAVLNAVEKFRLNKMEQGYRSLKVVYDSTPISNRKVIGWNLACMAHDMQDWDVVIEILHDQIISIHDKSIWRRLIDAFFYTGKIKQALDLIENYSTLYGVEPQLQRFKASVEHEALDVKKAINSLSLIESPDFNDLLSLLELNVYVNNESESDKYLKLSLDYELTIRQESKDIKSRLRFAHILSKLNRTTEAIDVAYHSIRLAWQSPDHLHSYISIFLDTKSEEEIIYESVVDKCGVILKDDHDNEKMIIMDSSIHGLHDYEVAGTIHPYWNVLIDTKIGDSATLGNTSWKVTAICSRYSIQARMVFARLTQDFEGTTSIRSVSVMNENGEYDFSYFFKELDSMSMLKEYYAEIYSVGGMTLHQLCSLIGKDIVTTWLCIQDDQNLDVVCADKDLETISKEINSLSSQSTLILSITSLLNLNKYNLLVPLEKAFNNIIVSSDTIFDLHKFGSSKISYNQIVPIKRGRYQIFNAGSSDIERINNLINEAKFYAERFNKKYDYSRIKQRVYDAKKVREIDNILGTSTTTTSFIAYEEDGLQIEEDATTRAMIRKYLPAVKVASALSVAAHLKNVECITQEEWFCYLLDASYKHEDVRWTMIYLEITKSVDGWIAWIINTIDSRCYQYLVTFIENIKLTNLDYIKKLHLFMQLVEAAMSCSNNMRRAAIIDTISIEIMSHYKIYKDHFEILIVESMNGLLLERVINMMKPHGLFIDYTH
tara:strand:+ start:986 stop:4684 length:3699 start_codon:yes stop_codon:yes gene_type:complete